MKRSPGGSHNLGKGLTKCGEELKKPNLGDEETFFEQATTIDYQSK